MIDFISQPGQFSVRGSIIDIFSHNNENPVRLEIYNEILVEIREFEIHTQLTQKNLILLILIVVLMIVLK